MRGKLIFVLLFLTVFLSLSAFAQLQCGDCDGNHFVNILDAHAAAKYGVGTYLLPEPQFSACNVAGTPGNHYYPEASVGSSDSLFISQYVVGRRSKLDCILDDPYVFTSGRYSFFRIFLMDQDGSNQREVRFNGSNTTHSNNPAMSPDGKWIVFEKIVGPIIQIFRVPITVQPSDNPEQLTFNTSGHNTDPVWSPDGKKIAFTSGRTSPFNYNLYVLDLSTRQEQMLVSGSSFGSNYYVLNPEWSHDGSEIVFAAGGPGGSSGTYYIYKVSSSGGSVQQLTTTPTLRELGWGLDGRIAFMRNTTFPASVFTMNSNGSNETLLTIFPDLGSSVSWHRDGGSLLFTSGSQIYNMAAFSGAPINQLTTLGGNWDARH